MKIDLEGGNSLELEEVKEQSNEDQGITPITNNNQRGHHQQDIFEQEDQIENANNGDFQTPLGHDQRQVQTSSIVQGEQEVEQVSDDLFCKSIHEEEKK